MAVGVHGGGPKSGRHSSSIRSLEAMVDLEAGAVRIRVQLEEIPVMDSQMVMYYLTPVTQVGR